MSEATMPVSKLADATPAEAAETVTEHNADQGGHGTTTGISNNKLMMWAFLGSECLLFGALISTYLLYKERFTGFAEGLAPFDEDGRNIGPRFGGENGEGVFDIPFTSISSFILLGSSLTMVLALSAIRRSEYRSFRIWTLTTAALGSVFIAGQIYEFTEFVEKGLGFSTNIFADWFPRRSRDHRHRHVVGHLHHAQARPIEQRQGRDGRNRRPVLALR